jgi:hypothetical protein
MPNDAAVAAPSAAASESILSVPTKATEYAEWRQSGTLPTKKEAPAASEDQPTNKDDAAPSKSEAKSAVKGKEPEAAPDPESGKQEPKKGKISAKERAAQVDDEIAELEQKLARRAELRKQLADPADDKKTAETSTAKPEVKEAPKGLEPPVKPKWDDFKDKENAYEEYEAAKDEYSEKKIEYEVKKARAEERAQQQQEKAVSDFAKRLDEAKERYSDFDVKKLDDAAGEIISDQTIPAVVKQMFRDTAVPVDLLYTMTSNADDWKAFLELARKDPLKAVRKLAVTENLVIEELSKKAPASKKAADEATVRNDKGQFQKTSPDDDDEPPAQVPPKKTTAAPAPADEVGTRGSAPPDAVASAAKRNDFQAFKDAANRRDQARRRG